MGGRRGSNEQGEQALAGVVRGGPRLLSGLRRRRWRRRWSVLRERWRRWLGGTEGGSGRDHGEVCGAAGWVAMAGRRRYLLRRRASGGRASGDYDGWAGVRRRGSPRSRPRPPRRRRELSARAEADGPERDNPGSLQHLRCPCHRL